MVFIVPEECVQSTDWTLGFTQSYDMVARMRTDRVGSLPVGAAAVPDTCEIRVTGRLSSRSQWAVHTRHQGTGLPLNVCKTTAMLAQACRLSRQRQESPECRAA